MRVEKINIIKTSNLKKCSKCNELKDLSEFHKSRADCKDCYRITKNKYLKTETGFLNAIYSGMKSKKRKKGKLPSCHLTKEEFLNLWELHKKIYGMKCYYLGIDLKFERRSDALRMNQVSVDRIDSTRPYHKDNIVFCSSLANNMKGHCNLEIAKKNVTLSESKPYEESHC
jgi:hypothetical protein